MQTLQQTLDLILSSVEPITEQRKNGLIDALGHYLAEDIVSTVEVPPADNSAMDGYALTFNDGTPDQWYPVTQTINAGHTGAVLAPGTAARIFTGAEVPSGADTVAMQENCELSDDGQAVRIRDTQPGDNIRRQGQDIAIGAPLFARGHRLTPVDIGMLASIGKAEVNITRPLRVAIVSTGDELQEPGEKLHSGQIYNSNRYLLHTALQSLNCTVMDLGRVQDDLESTCQTLLRGSDCDLILSTGGVSVGDADFIKAALAKTGAMTSWKLAIKPGKPLAYGRVGTAPFVGLPGNPVAVFVTFLLVVKPLLNHLRQRPPATLNRPFPSGFKTTKTSNRTQYLRVKINAQGQIERFGNQSSGVLSSLSWADGLAVVEAGKSVAIGDFLPVILLNDHAYN